MAECGGAGGLPVFSERGADWGLGACERPQARPFQHSFSFPTRVGEGQHCGSELFQGGVRAVSGRGPAHKAGSPGALSPPSQEPLPWLRAWTEPKTLEGRHQGLCDVPGASLWDVLVPESQAWFCPRGGRTGLGSSHWTPRRRWYPISRTLSGLPLLQMTHWKRP